MDAPWRIELLGGLRATGTHEVGRGDRILTRFRRRKTGALLAYLAFYLHRSHPRDELIELYWPECDLEAGRNNLRVALSSLRRQLEPPGVPAGAVIVADRASVRLNPAAITTDVAQFEAALSDAARAPSGPERVQRLTEAIALYRGELLPGSLDDWVLPERQRVAEAFHQAVQRLIALLEQAGDLSGALQYAHQAVAADPLREEAHRKVIRLLVAAGQTEAALRQYRDLERRLEAELGTRPDAETHALADALAARANGETRQAGAIGAAKGNQSALRRADREAPPRRDPGTVGSPLPPPRPVIGSAGDLPAATGVSPIGSLPLQFTRLFGRRDELGRLVKLLHGEQEAPRLITLTGPGGSGKTRLALEVARRLQEPLQGAIWFVPLADLADPRLIADKVLDAMRLPRAPGAEPLAQAAAALSRQPALLLLDNFEHLVHGGAAVVRTLLERAPLLTCLITSRRRLNLTGEREFQTPPLPVPAETTDPEQLIRCESVGLFVDRAQAVQPDFQVTRANASAVATLCRRLEGIPLALELAAARAQVLAPAQMLAHLERRFELLVSRQRDAEPRHRTLWMALDWSFQLLPPALQRFFAQLGVFRGGWTLGAAEAVCREGAPADAAEGDRGSEAARAGPALEYLEHLRECSLVVTEPAGEEMRFRLLETLREFAWERLTLEERTAVERRHLAYFLGLAEKAEPHLLSAERNAWLERLEAEHDNLRAALCSSQAGNRAGQAASAAASTPWCEAGEEDPGLRLAGALLMFWYLKGYLREGRRWLEAVLARADGARCAARSGRTTERAKALYAAGALAWNLGDYAAARARLEESVPIWREQRDNRKLALVLVNLGLAARDQGELVTARSYLEESVAIAREVEDPWALVWSLLSLGTIACRPGEYDEALSLHEEALAISRQLGDKWIIAWSLLNLGEVARLQREHARAASLYRECLPLFHELGNKPSVACTLEALATVASAAGKPEQAAQLFGAAEALREVTRALRSPIDRIEHERVVEVTRLALDEAVLAATWAEGRAMTWEQIIAATDSSPAGAPQTLPTLPSTNTPPRPRGSLPIQFTRFFGRKQEIAQLLAMLQSEGDAPRLVTLTGPGGSGKTRLALAVAERLREPFQDAVWFVPLSDLADSRLIVDKAAEAMRLPRSPGVEPLEQVVAALSRRPSLLLLDNFEHLVDEGALLVRSLLEQVPALTCLVTSRQWLHLAGEREFPVPPLPTPDWPESLERLVLCESVRLFVDRAQAVRPDFQVTPGNAAAVAALCEQLEGIPLALELAAARVYVLTPAQMLDRLSQRFELLVNRQRDAAPRHRSLRAALGWSYRLLPPALQRLFAQLYVFRGGWTLAAAEAVCEEPRALDYLEQLRSCSLVLAEDGPREVRFRMLETLREYAQEQLGSEERAALEQRHAAYFLALAEEAEPKYRTPERAVWLERLETERDNLRAAFTWTRSAPAGAEMELRLAGALWWFLGFRGYFNEAREWLEGALSQTRPLGDTLARAKALTAAGAMALNQSDTSSAHVLLEEAILLWRRFEKKRDLAYPLTYLGWTKVGRGEYPAARILAEESLALFREVGDLWGQVPALNCLACVARETGDNVLAKSLGEESVAAAREVGDPLIVSWALSSLGDLARTGGDLSAARTLYEECLTIQRELGHLASIAIKLSDLGEIARLQGDFTKVAAFFEESLAIYQELGNREAVRSLAERLGELPRHSHAAAGTRDPR